MLGCFFPFMSHCPHVIANYLNEDIALQLFRALCSMSSQLVLESWGFDEDFVEEPPR